MAVRDACKPRKEVLKGDLDDAIFAADFGNLIAGKAPAVYGDAFTFFENTHPAKSLCKVVQAVFARLAATKEGGATIRLSTGFGGGKTHTLMALWHLANNIADVSLGTDLLPAAGRPKQVTVAAVDAAKAGVPEFISHGKTRIHSLWGEIFYQLGGDAALKALGKADDPEASPNEGQVEKAFPKGPVLILLDELVIYMAKLSERGQGNLLGFLNSLASVVSRRPQTVLIVTDPAGQVAYASQSASLARQLQAAAQSLNDIFDRKVSDFDPIGKESARVITRRLFEHTDPAGAQAASAAYHSLYERVLQEKFGVLPPDAASADYARRIVECYPFHPRLLDTATDRLGALGDFQKSRGVLRLFARIIRDVWDAKQALELITAGDIDWGSDRVRSDLLERLQKPEFKAAISADIDKHAHELDGGRRGIHVRVASALLLESIPMQSSSGMEPADVTLAVLRPDEAGPEPAEALERLMGVCWHTYPTGSGRGCQFRYEPNVLKQIEERMVNMPVEDARSRVLAEAQGYFQGMTFRLASWPTSAKQVPNSADLQLALCEDEKIARTVVACEDDSDPAAPMPRGFQNAIVAVAPTHSALNEAVVRSRRLLAAEAIQRENKTGDAGKLVREQLKRIEPELRKQFQIQTRRTFDQVVLPGGIVKHMDETDQVPDDKMLEKPQGQRLLREYLEKHSMIYQAGQAPDVDLFMRDVLPGATPLADKPGVFTAKAVHERFLSAPGLRLIPDGSVVRQTLLKALGAARIVIRLTDGRAYDAKGHVQGPEGRRRRVPDTLTSLTLDDSVWVTRADSEFAATWTKEDAAPPPGKKGPEGGGPGGGAGDGPPPPPPSRVTPSTWDKVLEYAETRPLLELHLVAHSPADAAALMSVAQPLGAEQLMLSVSTGGGLRDGGTMNFAANDVKPNHPAKPLTVAQTVYNSLADGGEFEADLKLAFGAAGRTGMKDLLQQARDAAPAGVEVRATLDKPAEGGK